MQISTKIWFFSQSAILRWNLLYDCVLKKIWTWTFAVECQVARSRSRTWFSEWELLRDLLARSISVMSNSTVFLTSVSKARKCLSLFATCLSCWMRFPHSDLDPTKVTSQVATGIWRINDAQRHPNGWSGTFQTFGWRWALKNLIDHPPICFIVFSPSRRAH
jgi:hypothetical protein